MNGATASESSSNGGWLGDLTGIQKVAYSVGPMLCLLGALFAASGYSNYAGILFALGLYFIGIVVAVYGTITLISRVW